MLSEADCGDIGGGGGGIGDCGGKVGISRGVLTPSIHSASPTPASGGLGAGGCFGDLAGPAMSGRLTAVR